MSIFLDTDSDLKKSIKLHEKYRHATALELTLGDGFLYSTSLLFKNVRNQLLNQGFQISNELNAESRDFFLTGLFQLDTILFKRKLFARQNANAIVRMAEKYSDIDIKISEISTHEVYSSLFHESIHCLICSKFNWKSLSVKEQPDADLFLSQVLAAESAAISFEFMLCAEYNEPHEKALALVNALGYQSETHRLQYSNLKQIIGERAATEWLFRGYYASNYYYQASTAPLGLFQMIFSQCLENDEKEHRAAIAMEQVFSIGFVLQKAFRNQTASIFFKLIGVEGDLKNAMRFDLLWALDSRRPLIGAFREIFEDLSSKTN